ncbi:FAD-binding domain-containing protein [Annulohypoxylon maeteangense]|uniref:FAD-binding domain-containing protein n=1 Tax=Annulohypoxylon maeteangense TaxID=1927788 RepID=UPI002007B77C|nr:FAD-binding domain-containing protein [Annulohypoxylon maeteangense]KAI0888068.1 FAD-binding domain-containing protein [Annulohypoxylon maeteangense]
MQSLLLLVLFALSISVKCTNFAFEEEQLVEADVRAFPAIAFGNSSAVTLLDDEPECREYPGSSNWPLEEEWLLLNQSLGGALIKGVPPAAVCYDGSFKDEAACTFLVRNSSMNRFYINNPVTVLSEWGEGDTCHATLQPQSGDTCTQGAFPTFVINATTARQIQIGVNFARNRNLRLVIKNTGHDFVGRAVGLGSLSIWTHYLKDFEYLPRYQVGEYDGKAGRVGAGIESWEMFSQMDKYNVTFVVAGGYTVGAYGGWMAGGGHSALASKYGLGADQVLSLQVVTADGRFITADPNQNTDLFYALRGGGGSTFGVVTSAVVKAHPYTTVLSTSIRFSTSEVNGSVDPSENEKFWKGFDLYHEFGKKIVDDGGTACMLKSPSAPYVSRMSSSNDSYSFMTDVELPNVSEEYLSAFVQPLLDDLQAAGIDVTARAPSPATNWLASARAGIGDTPGSSRFASRLLPRANFEDPELFQATQLALRQSIEEGYRFHGIHIQPTEAVAGYPGSGNAVNPAFRRAIMHADLFDSTTIRGLSPMAWKETHAQLANAMDRWRNVTPGAGAYINECDVEEPEWQQAFFGSNYERLLEIKKARDPWGVFYAPTTVGSEGWVVRTEDDMPTQNGMLCRAGAGVVERRGGMGMGV